MKSNRRRFLGLLGVGVAAGPLAAKQALDASIADQAGLNLLGAAGGGFTSGGLPASQGMQARSLPNQYIPHDQKVSKAIGYLKTFGVPEFFEKELRSRAMWVEKLDPDIASKKSWSMSVKIMTQRERSYQRYLRAYYDSSSMFKSKGIIEKLLGFEWIW